MGKISKTQRRILIASLLVLSCLGCAAQEPASSGPAKALPHAAIASAHYLATAAGHKILAQGGNAFDAAIAVSTTLAVVEPESSGIGGGAFWLLHRAADGFETMIDGREKAPSAAHRDMFLKVNGEVNRDLAVNGALAAGIPGEIAGVVHLAQNYGRLPLAVSLQPAIELAENGFPLSEKTHALMQYRRDALKRWPAAAKVLLSADGEIPAQGTLIRSPDQAWVLRQVAQHGRDGFYAGEVAKRLVDGVRAAGGIWTLQDLQNYQVVERKPLYTDYQGYRLVTAPPPSSGGAAIATMLNILEPYTLEQMPKTQRAHLITEAMRRAYRDRSVYLGDPDFFAVPVDMLTSQYYADGLRSTIHLDKATPSSFLPASAPLREGTDTSHFSVIDSEGNMVAATLTVNLPFGAAFMAPGTGFLLNNEMDDFSAKPGEPNAYGLIGFTANAIEPNKRMLSSMSPTFVIGEDKVAVLGTPGGSRIITMVLLGILDFVAGNEPLSWVSLPRFHHQYLPDQISAESNAFSPAELEALQALGHTVKLRERPWGNMHGVMWDKTSNRLSAASDPRWSVGRATVQ